MTGHNKTVSVNGRGSQSSERRPPSGSTKARALGRGKGAKPGTCKNSTHFGNREHMKSQISDVEKTSIAKNEGEEMRVHAAAVKPEGSSGRSKLNVYSTNLRKNVKNGNRSRDQGHESKAKFEVKMDYHVLIIFSI